MMSINLFFDLCYSQLYIWEKIPELHLKDQIQVKIELTKSVN